MVKLRWKIPAFAGMTITEMNTKEYILIIKHGALGDMVLATGPMQAIRNHHPNAHITLLTTRAFAELMKDVPFIDEIWIDEKPKAWQLGKLITLIKHLNSKHFSWVYDLQTSSRSTRYFKLFTGKKPNVSGLAKGSSHRHNTPERTSLHTIDRQKQQLEIAGITDVPAPNLDWLEDDISNLLSFCEKRSDEAIQQQGIATSQSMNTPRNGELKYAIIVPGGSAHRPEKRWPKEHFISLCKALAEKNITPLLIGTNAEKELLDEIEESVNRHPVGRYSVNTGYQAKADKDFEQSQSNSQNNLPSLINLCNQTNFAQLATLARDAHYAVGNDTGPMHMIAAAGCPCSVIFNTNASNPALCAPRGDHVTIITSDDLATVTPEDILQAIPSKTAA